VPKVWGKSFKVYQQLWKRRGQVFCEGCGRSIGDENYWKWQVVYIKSGDTWVTEEASSHLSWKCAGYVLLELMKGSTSDCQEE